MGSRKGDPLDGLLLLDKPLGITSNRALQIAKRLLGAAKAGHTGSLDPQASGMLPLCFGEATKFSRFYLEADKAYQATISLGSNTSTGDSEGEIISTAPVPSVTEAAFTNFLQQFTGELSQIPPMYSALKHQGQPLYKLARAGKSIERAPRLVKIHLLRLDRIHERLQNSAQSEGGPILLDISVICSTGTYIRTLAEDIGNAWGGGAHLAALRRLWVSPFEKHAMVSLETLESLNEAERRAYLYTIPAILAPILPTVSLTEAAVFCLLRGQAVPLPSPMPPGWVSLMSESGVFLGVGEVQASGDVVAPRRLVQVLR